MGLEFDILEFCKKVRAERPPPYQCPLQACERVYKSICGLQYHLVKFDHDSPGPAAPAPARRPRPRPHRRQRAPQPTADLALQSPPREALTFAEAQKVVQFEIDGKISRICIDKPLPVMSLEDWEAKNAELEKPLTFVEPPPEPHVKLPEASYRVIPEYTLADAPPRPNAYIRFIEKSAEELDGEVEYDVDEEDTAWLSIVNKMRVKQNLPVVSVDTLELLMDRLEKESYFQAAQNGQQPAAVVDEDAVCCICMDGECQNTNVILFCDMCNLAVHQDCYGVPYIPEGQWLCRRCLQSPSRLVNCVLCPNTGGAFKQTDQNTWAHVVCALWIPEVRFANTVFLEPIDSIETIPMARWKLQCMVCKQRGVGACIQCHKSNCYSAFHVTCAQQAGLYMKMDAVGAGRDPSQPVQVAKMAYCDAHTPAHVLQERRAQQESEGGDKKTDLSAVRQKGREKIKQARRVLALKRTWAPVVLVPTLPADRVAEIAQLAGGGSATSRAQLLKKLLAYWTLKRRHRNGVPLLRRLQSLTHHHGGRGAIPDGAVNTRELCNQLKYWQRIRQDLERARLLCELVRKRERMKAEYARVWERCLMHRLRPERAALHKLLRLLQAKDTSDIFSEPVDLTEVPDYSTVVKNPMDLSAMAAKLERGAYETIDDVERDFTLMIDNCLAYNSKDTVFYKAGVKMREQCLPIFRTARRDVRAAGMPGLCGRGEVNESSGEELDKRSRAGSVDSSTSVKTTSGRERRGTRERSISTAPVRERAARERTREPSPVSPRPRRAASVKRDKWSGTDDDMDVEEEAPLRPSIPKVTPSYRGRGRGRGRRGRRGRGRPSFLSLRREKEKELATETPTSGSETPAPATEPTDYLKPAKLKGKTPSIKSPSRKLSPHKSPPRKSSPHKSPSRKASPHKSPPHKSPTGKTKSPRKPSKSPVKSASMEVSPTGIGMLGRKTQPSLSAAPSSGIPCKSFGSDAKLPTLSASMGRIGPGPEIAPKKKGRGRPRKHDKEKEKLRSLSEAGEKSMSGSTPVPASFLQYRGPPGEAGSDSDIGGSRSSSSSSAWSCSSCTHYDDDDLTDHFCSSSSSDGSSYNETMDSNTNQTVSDSEGRGASRGRQRRVTQCSSDNSDGEALNTTRKGRGTRSSSSRTATKVASDTSLALQPLQLVWAKCRGYPWYPALIIDPKMPKGFVYNGVPLPVPPQDVLNLKKNAPSEPHLVLFFDAKRTWQWLPRSKLEPLGFEKSVDQSKLMESRKPADRKAVKKAYGDAMHFSKQVDGEVEK